MSSTIIHSHTRDDTLISTGTHLGDPFEQSSYCETEDPDWSVFYQHNYYNTILIALYRAPPENLQEEDVMASALSILNASDCDDDDYSSSSSDEESSDNFENEFIWSLMHT